MSTTKLQVGGVEHEIEADGSYVVFNGVTLGAYLGPDVAVQAAWGIERALCAAKPVETDWNKNMLEAPIDEFAFLEVMDRKGIGYLSNDGEALLWIGVLDNGQSFEFDVEFPMAWAPISIPDRSKRETKPVENDDDVAHEFKIEDRVQTKGKHQYQGTVRSEVVKGAVLVEWDECPVDAVFVHTIELIPPVSTPHPLASETYDLKPLVAVLRAGAEIPGFHIEPPDDDGNGGLFWNATSIRHAPPEAYFAAVGWLDGRVDPDDVMRSLASVPRPQARLDVLCAAWLKENGHA